MLGERRDPSTRLEIASRLRLLRVALYGEGRGSQVRICKRTGIGTNAWSNYESGARRISIDQAIKIVKTVGVTRDWIYDGDSSGVRDEVLHKLQAVTANPQSKPPKRKRA